ncbi:Phosphoenolpyruvate carboxykinase [ATP] [compost metagenome]
MDTVEFVNHKVFGIAIPQSCPNVPSEILNPRNTWENKELYDAKASELAHKFEDNFAKFKEFANEEILAGSPIA